MNKSISLFAVITLLLTVSSCGISYDINGSSDISGYDSRKMYIQVFNNNEEVYLDSTEILHGKFNFSSSVDSSMMAFLQIDRKKLYQMPIVIEGGQINVRIGNSGTPMLGGTVLNDRLYQFLKTRDSLSLQAVELDHEYYRAFMDNEDMSEVVSRLARQQKQIYGKLDTLITTAISDNFNNVLGPGIFMLITQDQVPEMSPLLTSILSKATDTFKNAPYVKQYLIDAERVQNEANGLATPAAIPEQSLPQAPTPNEMAQPSEGEESPAQMGESTSSGESQK